MSKSRHPKLSKKRPMPDAKVLGRVAIKAPFTGTIGIAVFDNIEDLDFAGPWEVLKAAVSTAKAGKVVSISAGNASIQTRWGVRMSADHTLADAPELDVLVVPGGSGAYAVSDAFVEWVRTAGSKCDWVTSVCTGAFVLQRAGILAGKRATTWWGAVANLRALGVETLDDVRFVRDGKVITSAGVSAGIDMALWLTGRLYTPAFARSIQKYIEYYPSPPYAWEA